MSTFVFTQKNSGVAVTISADTYEEAEAELFEVVKSDYGWRGEEVDAEW
jgi:hypothetical protein